MISIILPSTGRERRLDELLIIMEAALPPGGEIIVVLDRNDHEAFIQLPTVHPKIQFIMTVVRGCWRCKNVALEHAKHDLILWTADDVRPHPGWLKKGIECFNRHFPDGLGLVAFNDLHCMDQTAGHAITTRRFLRVMFGYPHFPPEFWHFFLDTMTSDRAKALGRYHFCEDVVVEHMHWRLGKSEYDATNKWIDGQREKNDDKAVKDAMDEIWLHQGGLQEAVNRLREAS